MGIFDDAIRQHLDLKRRQGADEDELQQLEDEAFGPPARPGDPDFPETGESAAEGGAETDRPAEAASEPREAATAEEPIAPVAEPSDEAAPHGDALLADPDAKPEARPADQGPVEDAGADSFSTTEREAIADQPTEFFDQTPEPIELGERDLDSKDEPEATEDQPPTGEGPAPVDEATPVDEMRVVEETEPASEETAVEPEQAPGEEASAGEAEEVPVPADAEAEDGEEGEDVLEETPEFLRDNPDDDELWFEQGEPKDFDF